MVGGGLDGLDRERIGFAEVAAERIQLPEGGCGERRDFGDVSLRAERLEPFDLDQHAKADQAEFAEVSAQGIHLAVITSVER